MVPQENIYNYDFNDEMILFDANRKRLYRANQTASIIWKGITLGIKCEEIVKLMAQSLNMRYEIIERDIMSMMSLWHQMGLMNNLGSHCDNFPESPVAMTQNNFNDIIPAITDCIPRLMSGYIEHQFDLLDTLFILRFPTTLHDQVRKISTILNHFNGQQNVKSKIMLEIVKNRNRYEIFANGVPIDWCEKRQEIVSMVYSNLKIMAYDFADFLIGIHAAAVYRSGKYVIMPAPSSSGKSTLTAALIKSGFQFCTDDLVLLTAPSFFIKPLPGPISLKSGSWDAIKRYYPQINKLPVYIRADGTKIRYLSVTEKTINPKSIKAQYKHFIVFPFFIENGKPVVSTIGTIEALFRIAKAGYHVRMSHAGYSVRRFIDWIDSSPCYEVRFNCLDKAVGTLLDLIK